VLAYNPLNGATGGIWRVERDGRPAVLKIATPPGRAGVPSHWETSNDPGHWNYWRREALAYREGFAGSVYTGIPAPSLVDYEERADGSVALWLEYIDGTPGTAATPAMLGAFAERLGAAHAAWVDRSTSESWLSRDWLRAYTTSRPVTEPIPWDHPTAVAAWPDDLRAGLRELWLRRHEVLRATDALPRTLCHHDVWPMNLVFDGSGPVLLDWSFVGPGPVGEDAANLVLDTFFDGLVDVALLDEVVELVTDGYANGDAAVRRAVRLSGAAKYFWLAPMMLNRVAAGAAPISQAYDSREAVAMFAGRRRPLELVVAWFREALG
jgi:hypothetical protein